MKKCLLISVLFGLISAVAFDSTKSRAKAQSYEDEVLADSPFVYYRFNETDGTQAIDSSGNDRHGTYVGGVELGQASVAESLASAALFDGESGFVQLGALGFESDQLTIEAWINLSSLDDSCCTSIFSPDGWEQGWLHYNLKGDTNVEFALNSGGPNNHNTDPETIPFDKWVHLASVYDKDEAIVRTYVDGEEVDVFPPNFNTPQTVNLTVDAQIGAWQGTRFLGGLIDEFAIYDAALPAERIQAHRTATTSADLDGNGTVDLADYEILTGNFNTVGTASDGDLNLNGLVDLPDFVRFRSVFEAGQTPAFAVPEPSGSLHSHFVLLAILTCARSRLTNRRSKVNEPRV